jgi:lysophospholipase L1-like esterase
MRLVLAAVTCVAALTFAACGGGSSTPTTPTPPVPPAPTPITLTCPTAGMLRTTTGTPVPLTYALPQATGGTAPVSVTCTPGVGTAAPVGQTTVSCTATDARAQTATCSFQMSVLIAPTLSVERFLALGDSFTFGTTSRTLRVIEGDTYVQKLESLLRERYPDQTFTVANAGVPGQFMDQIEDRYPAALRQANPQVLLLQGGVNDLNTEGARSISDVVTRLERITRDAQQRRVSVVLATLTPQRPGSTKGTTAPAVLRDLNGRILDLCRRYQTGCVDLYAAFGGEQSPLIGSDGLHPTPAGYDTIAEAYFEVIRRLFERPAVP